MIKRVLVANRGEIACRIIRTAKRLGVESVAIFSDVDRGAKFVEMADQAHNVGGNLSSQSYLNKKKILQVAVDSRCCALHPGFGFLSENASFAEECARAGVAFVGPPASAIRAMGSKSESKRIMTRAGVPVVPGYHDDEQDPNHLLKAAAAIGYPVLIKAVSGGGGKGMRIVHQPHNFLEALDSCKRESLKAFADDRVIIEKYITRPRHIEVQVFGDQFANYVHLYERDCSIQRRHQKVVEEAPSGISDSLRSEICKSATDAAKAVGYQNAGTVEFIFDLDNKQHYFMEMNTRLQVEHPISEMITGFDFVQWQLKVVSGFPLPKLQHQIEKKGHAVEVRIYAEDPFNKFLPGTGVLKYFKEPVASENVRIETGVREGDTISTFYDPMIAKLVTYGANREQAIEHMTRALTNYRVVGLNNNLTFLKRVITNDTFKYGQYDTSFIDQNIDTLLKKTTHINAFQLISAAVIRTYAKSQHSALPQELWNFRNVCGQKDHHTIAVQETSVEGTHEYCLTVEYTGSKQGIVHLNDNEWKFQFKVLSKNVIDIMINGRVEKKQYFVEGANVTLFDTQGDSLTYRFKSDELKERTAKEGVEMAMKAPMPGIITKVYHKVGDRLKKGDSIVAMEAMKMELVIKAEIDCVIAAIHFKEGEFVQANAKLIELTH